ISSAAGPFVITAPAAGAAWSGQRTVLWNVAGTTGSPINAATVNILLSTDGGNTFPITLASGTPNDGSETVVLPNITTSQARIKVAAAGNIFFDISHGNFSIVPGIPTPLVTLESATIALETCSPTNNAIDPTESVTVNFSLQNTGTANTTNLVATLLATGGVTVPSAAQNYGALVAGGASVSKPFTFTGTGSCGGTITATFQLQDGSSNLGTLTKTFNLGAVTSNTKNFTNTTSLTIPSSGTKGNASPYPSTIAVTGVTGTVNKVTVTLRGLGHTFPSDVEALLVGPAGQTVLLMADVGSGDDISGVNLTFDDAASAPLTAATIVSGTYQPMSGTQSTSFTSPAPASPYGATLAAYNGINANGTWSLYVDDDASTDTGSMAQGWSLSISTLDAVCTSCIPATNNPPIISSISGQSGNEDTSVGPIAFTISDAETPAASLTLSVDSSNTNLVPVSNIVFGGSGTNRIVTITPVAHRFGTSAISLHVSDGTNTANQGFLLTINDVNHAPALAAISNQSINEGSLLTMTNIATDVDIPAQALTFSLDVGAPIGVGINATNGIFTWLPTEAQGPGSYNITVRVTDNGSPNLSDTKTFSITVNEVNIAPVLLAIADRVVHAGSALTITNTATDNDLPANTLTFSLDAGAPSGTSIDATSGTFTWAPGDNQAGSTNSITVRVTDNGLPILSDAKTFSVTVVSRPVIESIAVSGSNVTLTWSAIAGKVYRVQTKSDITASWNDLTGDVTASGSTATKVDSSGLASELFYRVIEIQ
ncbi:MAG: hypothetical protein JWQ71_3359, partial [Pedosphaera sp.]|nr:hypothetical protein [Pedosphaera sp.]